MVKRIFITALLALASLAGFAQVQSTTQLLGTWSGKINAMGSSLTMVFHLEQADGYVTVELDVPDQGAKGIGCHKDYLSDDSIAVKIQMINATYCAKLKDGVLDGVYSQDGMSFPLKLKPGAEKPNRPQTPQPPFPYKEEELSFQNDGFTFHGTLTLPEVYNKETPVLVMVTGSGQQDRDEELMDHRPFAVIADVLTRHGIATFRYDDRGWDDKSFPYFDYTVKHHKSDAEAALRMMRERFANVGVIGHSEGGTIGLMLAAEGKVDCCISLAGMAVSGKETLLEQNNTLLSSLSVPSDIVNSYCQALGKAFDDIAAGQSPENIDDSNVPLMLKENFQAAVKQSASPYMRSLLMTDVRQSLPSIKCPVLALGGNRDMQVNAAINLEAIDKGLASSKHEVVAYNDLNHLFQHCQTGLINEYRTIEETIAPEVLTKIVEWIKSL